MIKLWIAAFVLASCGTEGKPGNSGEPGQAGIPGQPGLPGNSGNNGVDGMNGTGCTLAKVDEGVLVTCADSTVLIKDGANGTDGEDGEDGKTIVVPGCGKKKE